MQLAVYLVLFANMSAMSTCIKRFVAHKIDNKTFLVISFHTTISYSMELPIPITFSCRQLLVFVNICNKASFFFSLAELHLHPYSHQSPTIPIPFDIIV